MKKKQTETNKKEKCQKFKCNAFENLFTMKEGNYCV